MVRGWGLRVGKAFANFGLQTFEATRLDLSKRLGLWATERMDALLLVERSKAFIKSRMRDDEGGPETIEHLVNILRNYRNYEGSPSVLGVRGWQGSF